MGRWLVDFDLDFGSSVDPSGHPRMGRWDASPRDQVPPGLAPNSSTVVQVIRLKSEIRAILPYWPPPPKAQGAALFVLIPCVAGIAPPGATQLVGIEDGIEKLFGRGSSRPTENACDTCDTCDTFFGISHTGTHTKIPLLWPILHHGPL